MPGFDEPFVRKRGFAWHRLTEVEHLVSDWSADPWVRVTMRCGYRFEWNAREEGFDPLEHAAEVGLYCRKCARAFEKGS